ncbi:hypothetical protein Poly24_03380 [Rosistilla carotiformis]|uniref:Uncharacterized protein n=1 Tax=Rosistilla carotiformis TaxID=2528017 RepID=A0A518JM79_9BACT|nr:hypothetical protein Poly24_03380 [Rosistilla carotiformis]
MLRRLGRLRLGDQTQIHRLFIDVTRIASPSEFVGNFVRPKRELVWLVRRVYEAKARGGNGFRLRSLAEDRGRRGRAEVARDRSDVFHVVHWHREREAGGMWNARPESSLRMSGTRRMRWSCRFGIQRYRALALPKIVASALILDNLFGEIYSGSRERGADIQPRHASLVEAARFPKR